MRLKKAQVYSKTAAAGRLNYCSVSAHRYENVCAAPSHWRNVERKWATECSQQKPDDEWQPTEN